jgi:hypothetical protein
MMHLWGRLSSLNVRKVVWAAQETGVPFTRSDAGMAFGVVKTPKYLNLNPNALVPTLQDGELVLWESNVIVRYLCARYAPTLYPQDLAQRFHAERWMDWQQTTLNRAGGAAFLQWIRTPQSQRDHAAIAQSVAGPAPVTSRLHGRRTVQHGRHSGGLRHSPLVWPAAATPGAAPFGTVVRQHPRPPCRSRGAGSTPVLTTTHPSSAP